MLGQSVLFFAALVLLFPWVTEKWGWLGILLLGLWQLASALHLYISYRDMGKADFIKTILVVLIAMPLWMKWVGHWAYIPVLGLLGGYFIHTIRYWLRAKNKHLSFWDMEF